MHLGTGGGGGGGCYSGWGGAFCGGGGRGGGGGYGGAYIWFNACGFKGIFFRFLYSWALQGPANRSLSFDTLVFQFVL